MPRSMSNNEAPRAGRRITGQAANRNSQANQPRQTGNATNRETAAGSRAIVQRVQIGGVRQGTLARSGLVQDAGGKLRGALVDIARQQYDARWESFCTYSRRMAAAPRLQSRASMAVRRADVATTSVAPAEVMSGRGYDARQTQAEVINNRGPAQERTRHKRDWPSSSRSVIRLGPTISTVRARVRPRVGVNQRDMQQRPRKRVVREIPQVPQPMSIVREIPQVPQPMSIVREIPQVPQPMSIDRPIWGVHRRENHESGRQQEAAQLNVQGQPVQHTDAGVVSNQLVVEHHGEIENRSRVPPSSMPIQTNIITEEFRARMSEYLRSLQQRGQVIQETCNLSKNLLDRYCSVGNISEENWQLVAIAVLFLAAKYEEVWPPTATRFGERRFTLSEIMLTEQAILKALDYKITIPTAIDYVRRFIKVANSVEEEKNLAFFLTNLSLGESETRYSPAFIAAAAVYAAQCRIRGAPQWTDRLEHHTGYTGQELMSII